MSTPKRLLWRQQERLGALAWRGPEETTMLMAARAGVDVIAAVIGPVGPQGPDGILSLTSDAIDEVGGDPTARQAIGRRVESYVQAGTPDTTEAALWFDTANPSFLTLKIQRG